jgi:hypothetical protein
VFAIDLLANLGRMKLTLSTIAFLLISAIAIGQQSRISTNLIVRFDENYSKNTSSRYYIIRADWGNPNAALVYNLIPYKPEKDAINTGGVFFQPENDTANTYYNYFPSPTAAMEYLSHRGWHLVTVISEVVSGEKFVSLGSSNTPITTVSSRPIYYFKKELQ